jgi:predicted ABC-type ATPase
VKIRVREGGHFVDPEVIKRSYTRGLQNLFELYLDIPDSIMIFDNSEETPELIAEKTIDHEISILNPGKFESMKN